jgi:hypothetical protein
MVRLINSNGLRLNLVKLNGKLELLFAKDASFTAQYTCHGTDIEDTVEMEYAREAAAGQLVVFLGLEMFMENVEGCLEIRYEGVVGIPGMLKSELWELPSSTSASRPRPSA